MGKKIICLLLMLSMIGCSTIQSVLKNEILSYTGEKLSEKPQKENIVIYDEKEEPWKFCPLLKYPIIEKFYSPTTEAYFIFVHDIDGDGRADVIATYYFSESEDEIYEVERFWLTGKYGFNFK